MCKQAVASTYTMCKQDTASTYTMCKQALSYRNDRVSSLFEQKLSPVYKNPARRYHVAKQNNLECFFISMGVVRVFFRVFFFIIVDSDRDSTNKNCPGSIRILQEGIMLRSNEGRMMVPSTSVGCHTTTTAYFFNLGKQSPCPLD